MGRRKKKILSKVRDISEILPDTDDVVYVPSENRLTGYNALTNRLKMIAKYSDQSVKKMLGFD